MIFDEFLNALNDDVDSAYSLFIYLKISWIADKSSYIEFFGLKITKEIP